MNKSDTLRSIIKASEAIRRKHRFLKQGKEAVETSLNEVFKPIITPLNNLVTNSSTSPTSIKTEIKEESTSEIEENNDQLNETNDNLPLNDNHKQTLSISTALNVNDLQQKYLNMLYNNRKSVDHQWGLRKLEKVLFIGNAPIKFEHDYIYVAEDRYKTRVGLIELLFSKSPDTSIITDKDVENYLKIVQSTNAHKKHYKPDEDIRTSDVLKFTKYISRILHEEDDNNQKTGKSLFNTVQHIPFDYVYYDDPNELIDRLQLLIASQKAGNNNHTNEINSIIEELQEAGYIY